MRIDCYPLEIYNVDTLLYTNASGKIGIKKDTIPQIEGIKQYELSNHLGNVLVTISDRKMPKDDDNDTIAYAYEAVSLTMQDYYPFGMVMPGRSNSSGAYRFGFNGKENDNEVKGNANQQDYGMRIYDTRLGKFLSVDPITRDYPELTPYQFASNSPISGIDLDGLEFYYSTSGNLQCKFGDNTQVRVLNDKFVKENQGKIVTIAMLNANSIDLGISNKELNTRAFLSTIRQAENGGHAPLDYNSANGFSKGKVRTFTDKKYSEAPKDYANHPGFLNGSTSSAAGAYQILKTSFNNYKLQNIDIKDFSPISQDKIAMAMIKYRKAGDDIGNADLKSASIKLTKTKGGEQFASLPGGTQQGITMDELKVLFKQNVINELNNNSIIATPKGELTKAQ